MRNQTNRQQSRSAGVSLAVALLCSFSACQTTRPISPEIPLLVRESTLVRLRAQAQSGESIPEVLRRLVRDTRSFPPESLIDEYEQGPIEMDSAPRQITLPSELLQQLGRLAGEGIGRTSSGIDFALQRLLQQIELERATNR